MPSSIAVTPIDHSCDLIEMSANTFLTDPWFSTRPAYYPPESPSRDRCQSSPSSTLYSSLMSNTTIAILMIRQSTVTVTCRS